jgi:amino acid permease
MAQQDQDDKNKPKQNDWCKWMGMIIVLLAFAVVAVVVFSRFSGNSKQGKIRRGGNSRWGASGGCGCMAGSTI